MSGPMKDKPKRKDVVFVIEWRLSAIDILDGLDSVREKLTEYGACEIKDVRVEDAE